MLIIYDTREQLPIRWPNIHRAKLLVGDYTTDKLFNIFHIERKSGQDLYGSIIQGHRRFRDMLIRADQNNIKLAIYVECTKSNFVNLKFARGGDRKMKPTTLEKIINTMIVNYKLNIVWCKDRVQLKTKIYNRLKKETKLYYTNENY